MLFYSTLHRTRGSLEAEGRVSEKHNKASIPYCSALRSIEESAIYQRCLIWFYLCCSLKKPALPQSQLCFMKSRTKADTEVWSLIHPKSTAVVCTEATECSLLTKILLGV